jgi:hypothetical protein
MRASSLWMDQCHCPGIGLVITGVAFLEKSALSHLCSLLHSLCSCSALWLYDVIHLVIKQQEGIHERNPWILALPISWTVNWARAYPAQVTQSMVLCKNTRKQTKTMCLDMSVFYAILFGVSWIYIYIFFMMFSAIISSNILLLSLIFHIIRWSTSQCAT